MLCFRRGRRCWTALLFFLGLLCHLLSRPRRRNDFASASLASRTPALAQRGVANSFLLLLPPSHSLSRVEDASLLALHLPTTVLFASPELRHALRALRNAHLCLRGHCGPRLTIEGVRAKCASDFTGSQGRVAGGISDPGSSPSCLTSRILAVSPRWTSLPPRPATALSLPFSPKMCVYHAFAPRHP